MEKIGAKESRKNKKKKMTTSDVVLIVIFVIAITVAAVSGYKLYALTLRLLLFGTLTKRGPTLIRWQQQYLWL